MAGIDDALMDLVLGKFTPVQWFAWWEQNESVVEQQVSQELFWHLKPNPSYTPFRATAYSKDYYGACYVQGH